MLFLNRFKHVVQLQGRCILITLGRIIGIFIRFENQSSIFFFFPYYHIGGAEKVHAEIVASVRDRLPWVFFTNRSKDHKFRVLFQDKARLFDLSPFASNRFLYLILLGVLVVVINRHPRAVVFGCNNAFFYRMIPYLKSSIRSIDLLHAFGGGIENTIISVAPNIDARVIVNTRTLSDLKQQYASLGFDAKIADRIILIENQVVVPHYYCEKGRNALLRVLYVGRGSKEKRVYLIGKAAARCHELAVPAEFILVGDVAETIEIEHHKHCTFEGEVADPRRLTELYDSADLLVLTSSREGFPMVIMEAMARGVVPISTNVGGISLHIKHGFNGMLISTENEDEIVHSIVKIIEQLSENRRFLSELSHNAHKYAREHFEPTRFYASYRKLILTNSC